MTDREQAFENLGRADADLDMTPRVLPSWNDQLAYNRGFDGPSPAKPERNVIWVDTASGTWGDVESSVGRLLIVDLDAVARQFVEDPGHGLHGSDFDGEALRLSLELEDDESSMVEFADQYGSLARPEVS